MEIVQPTKKWRWSAKSRIAGRLQIWTVVNWQRFVLEKPILWS